jgi:alanine-synthesizing transaminase
VFSDRVPPLLQPNRIATAVARAREAGRSLIDLTVTNPTAVGFTYPASLLEALASQDGLTYRPEPFGLRAARQAVALDYRRRNLEIDPDRIILTSSTSEAYSLLFKLLCNASGAAVLVPMPSYPLFEHLTMLDGVRAIPYRLEYHGRWSIDRGELSRVWTDDVRAVLAVSPNNPTGSVLDAGELTELQQACASRRAALILDEVFADYPLPVGSDLVFQHFVEIQDLTPRVALTFRLGGLSKSAGLPQVKLGWIAVEGPDALARDALARLEIICDAYLSVSTPVQVAAPRLIESGSVVRAQILERITRNDRALRAAAGGHPAVEVLETQAGWSTVLRVPSTRSEEDLVIELIDDHGVIVHPGFFFDFPHEAFVVVSLLPEPDVFTEGIARLLEHADV